MPNSIPITNIINVSVSQTPTGVNVLNTSNVALFSDDPPTGSFPAAGFGFYVTPDQVAADWGSSSVTFEMADAIFSQQPNILTPDGQLIIIKLLDDQPAVVAIQHIAFSSVPTVGTYKLNFGVTATTALAFGATNTDVQTALRTASGDATLTVTGDTSGGFDVTFTGISGPVANLTVSEDSLQDTTGEDVFLTVTTTVIGVPVGGAETVAQGISRTKGLVNYFGVISTQTYEVEGSTNFAAVAALVQPLPMMYFQVSATAADITGEFTTNTTSENTQTRCLYYGDSSNSGLNELLFKAAYVGRLLSVDFTASNTTLTAQLKQLTGVAPDPSMTQTLYNQCLTAGVDCYPSFQGYAGLSSSGANEFFDEVYNELSFASALQVAGFNYLAGTTTKIPQTESGMDGLKGAYQGVCQQYVANSYLAPGQWNSSTVFGNPADLIRNVSSFGYYIYSQPISLQSESQRMLRQAPLVQIAAKESGGIHSSNIVCYLNA
jgi:hypothetical protein